MSKILAPPLARFARPDEVRRLGAPLAGASLVSAMVGHAFGAGGSGTKRSPGTERARVAASRKKPGNLGPRAW